jgi:putative restriction endonuclease
MPSRRLLSANDLIELRDGSTIPAQLLYDSIVQSKRPGSSNWTGLPGRIGNTPQQGINWVGEPQSIRAVLIKWNEGAYPLDGWVSGQQPRFRYSLKQQKGRVRRKEVANMALLQQPRLGYPIVLLRVVGINLNMLGWFDVVAVAGDNVYLTQRSRTPPASMR